MAIVQGAANVELRLTLQIDEQEARALDAMAGYGDDAFVKAFYDKLGKAYMEQHENGLRSFLKSIRDFMPNLLIRADDARSAFKGPKRDR